MSYQPGDINNDGNPGTAADLVQLMTQINFLEHNETNSIARTNDLNQKDIDYLAKHIVGMSGYDLPSGGMFIQNTTNGNIGIGYDSVVQNSDVNVNTVNSIAIGNNAEAIYDNSIAIGSNASTDASNQISFGDASSNIIFKGSINLRHKDNTIDDPKYFTIGIGGTALNPNLKFSAPNKSDFLRVDTNGSLGISSQILFGNDSYSNGAWQIGMLNNDFKDLVFRHYTNPSCNVYFTNLYDSGSTNVYIDGNISGNTANLTGLNVTGNVGINTNTPTCIMDISSNDAIKVPVGDTSQRPTPSLGQIRYNSQLSTYEGFGAGDAWGSLGGVKDVNGDTYILAESSAGANNDELQFFTANNQRMIIDESGNVGIGISTPNYKLDVDGSFNCSEILVNGEKPVSSQWIDSLPEDTPSIYYNGGNVGIGTDQPEVALHISRAGDANIILEADQPEVNSGPNAEIFNPVIQLRQDGGRVRSFFGHTSGSNNVTIGTGYGHIIFSTAGNNATSIDDLTERMRIKSNGNVGIGTDDPKTALHINGELRANVLCHWIITSGTGADVWYRGTNMRIGSRDYQHGNNSSDYPGQGVWFNNVTTKGSAISSAWDGVNGIFTFPTAGLYLITLNLFYNSRYHSGRIILNWSSGIQDYYGYGFQYVHFGHDGYASENGRLWTFPLFVSNANETIHIERTTTGQDLVLWLGAAHTMLYINRIY